jgi:hypothetical protein
VRVWQVGILLLPLQLSLQHGQVSCCGVGCLPGTMQLAGNSLPACAQPPTCGSGLALPTLRPSCANNTEAQYRSRSACAGRAAASPQPSLCRLRIEQRHLPT